MYSVLISGGGVAGTALAYWLHRYGFEVTVLERADGIRDGGYAVDVRGAALTVLDRMDLLAKARQKNTDTLATVFVDEDGKRIATMDRGFGVADANDVEIMRGDLVNILYESTRNVVTYLFSDAIKSIAPDERGVHVNFEGNPSRTFDVVVGADGVHSNVRQLVFGEDAQFVQYLGSYMAVFSSRNFLELDRRQILFNQPGRVISVKSSNGNGDIKVTALFTSAPLTFARQDIQAQKGLVAAAFSNAGWAVPQLLDEMTSSADFYFDTTSLVRMPHWSRERVVLVGDACTCASPLSGQGTGLALVGAYVLAGELATAKGNYQTALARYEELMRPYADRNQEGAERIAKTFAPQTDREVRIRNFALKTMRYIPLMSLMFKMAARAATKSARAICLSDYEKNRLG